MRIIIALSAAALMLLAGCSGSSNDSNTGGNGGSGGNGGGSDTTGTDTTGGNGGSGGGAGGMVWNETSASGSFQSTPGGASGATGATVSFTLPEGATTVWFNVTITPTVPTSPASEFHLAFNDSDHFAPTDAPQVEGSTSGGKLSLSFDAPKGGDWRMYIFSEYAPNAGTYTVLANAYAPA